MSKRKDRLAPVEPLLRPKKIESRLDGVSPNRF